MTSSGLEVDLPSYRQSDLLPSVAAATGVIPKVPNALKMYDIRFVHIAVIPITRRASTYYRISWEASPVVNAIIGSGHANRGPLETLREADIEGQIIILSGKDAGGEK